MWGLFSRFLYLYIVMNRTRTLNIDYGHIKKALADPKYGSALALNVIIKANSVSSVIRNATYRELKRTLHIGNDTLKVALETGIKTGLIEKYTNKNKQGKNITYIRALPISRIGHNARLKVCDSDAGEYGKQIYLESNIKNNYLKYSHLTSYVTISDVLDLFVIVALDRLQKGYWTGRDQDLKRRLEKTGSSNLMKKYRAFTQIRDLEKDITGTPKVNDYNWLNTGYSYKKMAEQLGRYVSVYTVSRLMHRAIEDGLFNVIENRICVREGNAIKRHWNEDLGIPEPDKNSPDYAFQVFNYAYGQWDAIRRNSKSFAEQVYYNPYYKEYEDLDTRGYHGKKRTAHYKKLHLRMQEKGEDGKWHYVLNTDPNSKLHFAYKEKWMVTYTDEDRFKVFKHMANSYVRCSDMIGYKHTDSYYLKRKKDATKK